MAKRQTLKDARFRVIGYIDTDADGQQVLSDAQFRRLGSYDPKSNTTKDAQFRRIGQGNLLTTLLTG
ncbi:conserved protein of unknown function [Methylorubrum extorquens DM4]|uniref:Uncharacterized protein n=1 Tax=Methylorubrum extorquens (strain DSM 6343 / CIP 106787 / DM4) TaxID=661410 RepID=C7C7B1_METED|nr:hypothetical protein [Methylorubrum extorquens]CAX25020.1 conserved protein of unknown function [Methylorubrum extorquens DM4]